MSKTIEISVYDLEDMEKEIKTLKEENADLKSELSKFSEAYKKYRDYEKEELAESCYDLARENENLRTGKKNELEMYLLETYRKGLMKIKKYIEEYAFEKYGWDGLEDVEFSSHEDIIHNYPYNDDFLDRLVKTNKVDLDKTEDFYWEEGFKHIGFGKYLEDLFGNNDDYRIIFLIDVFK